MEPRILMLMDDEYARIEALWRKKSPYTFVRFPGPLKAELVEKYVLRAMGFEFDAVATFNTIDYSDIREVVENNYSGIKILFCTVTTSHSYLNQDKKYEISVGATIKPSDFDKLIERHFKDL